MSAFRHAGVNRVRMPKQWLLLNMTPLPSPIIFLLWGKKIKFQEETIHILRSAFSIQERLE
jgi:hypothetical protein